MAADPMEYTTRWRVRQYELDANGHVNNAVYLNYAEQVTIEHAEVAGYGRSWTLAQGGAWVVHHTAVTYHRPAFAGDELDLTVRVLYVRGTRGVRRTTIRLAAEGDLVADIVTEWVWVRPDGRPAMVPKELADLVRPATEATLAADPHFIRRLRVP